MIIGAVFLLLFDCRRMKRESLFFKIVAAVAVVEDYEYSTRSTRRLNMKPFGICFVDVRCVICYLLFVICYLLLIGFFSYLSQKWKWEKPEKTTAALQFQIACFGCISILHIYVDRPTCSIQIDSSFISYESMESCTVGRRWVNIVSILP